VFWEQAGWLVQPPTCSATTMLGMEGVIQELKKQGLRDKVKVVIGGGPVSKKYAEDIGADGYGNDAAQAVNLVRSLL
jgi:dimethylamine corrinoid protein